MRDYLITPLKGTDEPKDDFVVCDIENEENGDVLSIGVAFRERGAIRHEVFADWTAYTSFVLTYASTEKRFQRIWAHNGGGWDWLSYFQYLISNRHLYPSLEIYPVIVGSKYVVLQVDFSVHYSKNEAGTLERDCISIKFCDSLYMMRSSLEELSQKFLGKGKVKSELMAWDLYRQDKPKFFEYLKTDCENLLLILEKFYGLIRERICPLDRLGNTIGATALRIFRTHSKQTLRIPADCFGERELREFLRGGYFGGRVQVFKYGHHHGINVYDINSLYPFVMREHYYPVDGRTTNVSEFRRGIPGCYEILFRSRRSGIPPVFSCGQREGDYLHGIFFHPEIDLAYKMGYEIKIIRGIVFNNSRKIFEDFINKMWALRKSDYKGPLGTVCKFIMNSLYGKFCERPKTTKLLVLNGSGFENIQKVCNLQFSMNQERQAEGKKLVRINILDEENGTYLLEDDEAICHNEHVGIGGLITSWARVELYKRFLATGLENLVYCDTDSIHTFGELPTGTELGDLKHEHSGEGVYCGKKLYALRDLTHNPPYEKVTAKGVSFGLVGSNKPHQQALCFDDMVRISKGESILTEFSQPATAKETLKGKKACQILRKNLDGKILHNRKRTLRKT